jgi:hypothetical protein
MAPEGLLAEVPPVNANTLTGLRLPLSISSPLNLPQLSISPPLNLSPSQSPPMAVDCPPCDTPPSNKQAGFRYKTHLPLP